MLFYISNTFISNVRLKLVKNQAKAKQHPGAELLLCENYSLSSYTLSPQKRYSEKMYKKQVHPFKLGYMINDIENEAEKVKCTT